MGNRIYGFGHDHGDLVQANVDYINSQLARPSNRGMQRVVVKLDQELWRALEEYHRRQVLEMVKTAWRDVRVSGDDGHGAVSLHLGDPVRKLSYPTS